MVKTLLSTTAVALALANADAARADGNPAKTLVTTAEDSSQIPADRLIGMPVLTEDGEPVGTVEDLIRDGDNRMRGVVVAVGGIFDLGPKAVGVAWNQARIRSTPESGESLIILGVTSADLDLAPEFATDADADPKDAESAEQDLRSGESLPATRDGTLAQ